MSDYDQYSGDDFLPDLPDLSWESCMKLAQVLVEGDKPVVVFSSDEWVLHGEDVLRSITDLDMPLECRVVRLAFTHAELEASDFPEILEAARLVFMKHGPPSGN